MTSPASFSGPTSLALTQQATVIPGGGDHRAVRFLSYRIPVSMDSRLPYFHNQRLTHVRRSDCPDLALAIVGATRHMGVRVERRVYNTTPVVYLSGRGFNIIVRGEDWEKIVPYLRDGTFNPEIVPVERPQYLSPEVMLDVAILDRTDQDFYQRVLGVLQGLFLDDYPTSDL